MEDYSDYREKPGTGRSPGHTGDEHAPQVVAPSVLTDDRGNEELLTFEKTWGHRLLAGVGFAMAIIAVVVAIFCAFRLINYASVVPELLSLLFPLYGTGLILGLLSIVPALVGIYAAKHPSKITAAIVLAVIALACVAAFLVYALVMAQAYAITALLYSALLALVPVVYLIAAFKVRRSK